MLIEAIATLRVRSEGQVFTIYPGTPINLPEDRALRLLAKAPDKVRRVDSVSAIQPGDAITWQGADGRKRGPAVVDFHHNEPDGSMWAFCTIPDSWCAVNLTVAGVTIERATP